MNTFLSLAGLRYRPGPAGTGFELSVPHLHLEHGARVAVVGPSGCGKSTLLDILAFIRRPAEIDSWDMDTGDGIQDLSSLLRGGAGEPRLAEIRGRLLGYVLQSGGLLPFLTARANIELPRLLLGLRRDGTVERVVSQLGIGSHLDKLPSQLSVGERQRVAIARAVAHRPALVLADEPTAALDPDNARGVMEMLVELGSELGTTLMVASHDWELITRFGFTVLDHRLESMADGARTTSIFVH